MINNEWNRGKQYDLAETQIRNGQEIDLSRVSDETLLFYMTESLIKADVANEIARLILKEATDRGFTPEWLE